MIFERSLQRELAYTAGAVFMVLLTLVLTTMMIRIVGFAASGEIDPRDVLVLIGLTVIGYLAIMLVATLFVSILFVLTRWYRDSEMVVWLASGLSLTRFIKPIAVFSTPIIILIAFFVFVGWPWSNQQNKLIRARFQQRDEVSLLAPGQFRESTVSHRVFFIEKMSPDQSHVKTCSSRARKTARSTWSYRRTAIPKRKRTATALSCWKTAAAMMANLGTRISASWNSNAMG